MTNLEKIKRKWAELDAKGIADILIDYDDGWGLYYIPREIRRDNSFCDENEAFSIVVDWLESEAK